MVIADLFCGNCGVDLSIVGGQVRGSACLGFLRVQRLHSRVVCSLGLRVHSCPRKLLLLQALCLSACVLAASTAGHCSVVSFRAPPAATLRHDRSR